MLIAIFTWQIVGDYFLNIVSLWELNGLKLGKKQYIVAIYQTDIRYISVQEWNRLFELIDLFYGNISARLNGCELLREHDRRICYLLHARLDNSALGILFNIDNTSVTKSKQRIKKKLGLGPNDVLETFLNENKK